ncbi:hypothetical protein [Paenibacillus lactis]|uniref:hypothetical protein n=1 Tax=Paenibacillus lactis TaxID=228574 RepID=UPI0021B660BA
MKPVKRSKLRLWAGKQYFTCRRYWEWLKQGRRGMARIRSSEPLHYPVFEHRTPLMRRLKDVDMWYQHNKPEFRKPVFTVNMLQIRVDRVVNY